MPPTVESDGDLGGGWQRPDDLPQEVADSIAHIGVAWSAAGWPQAEIEEICETVGDHDRQDGWNDEDGATGGE